MNYMKIVRQSKKYNSHINNLGMYGKVISLHEDYVEGAFFSEYGIGIGAVDLASVDFVNESDVPFHIVDRLKLY